MNKIYFDSLNRIFNSYKSGKSICLCRYSKFILLIFGILLEKKIINNFYIININNKIYIICLINKLLSLKFYSKPSFKNYIKYKKINFNLLNQGLVLVTTNIGILTINDCKKVKIGGKILFSII